MRKFLVAMAVISLLLTPISCSTFKTNELSGKTDATVSYYRAWLVGAQIFVPLFGSLAPEAQVAINSALTALDLYSTASDMIAAGKLNATQLTASLLQVEEAIVRIKALGNQAGVTGVSQ